MNNDSIVVTAKLNVDASEALILKDLETIQSDLKSNPLQISCTISDSSIKQMQSQLDSLSKGLNINANVNAKSIQQSINQAVKSEPVRISVEADIKAGEIKRQAKELKEMWGIGFAGESKESIKALNAELQEMLTNYDKALKTNDFEAMMSSWDKISEFVDKYAGSVKNLTPEMEKLNSIMRKTRVLITEDDYKELERIYETRGEIQKVLNDALGIGKWSYDKSKASYGFDSFVNEINSNLYGDDSINKISEEITEGLKQISALRHADSQSTKEWEQYEEEILRQDANAWENHKNAVLNTLDAIRGETHSSEEFVDIFGDEEFQQTESNMQAFEDGLRKIEALKVQIKAEGGDAIKSVSASFTADANRNIDGFVLKVRKSSGEVENLYHKLQEAEDETGNLVREWERYKVTGSDAGVTKAIEQASKAADALGRKLNNLYTGATDENAARPIKTQSGKDAIAEAYNKATEAVNALRNANAATFAELDNEAKSAVDNLNNVIKAQRNAETAATKLRTKSVSEIKDEELLNLDRFVANISNSAIPSIEHLKDEVDSLREQLQQVGEDDKQGLINYLIAFSNLEEEFKAINTEARTVKKALKELDNLTNSSQLKKNASNPEVASQISDIQAIRNEYSKLLAELGQAKTPEAIQNISNRIAQLKPQFDAVVQSSKQLNDSLVDKKASSDFNSKLNNLTNQMGTFERTNRRATESLKLMRDGVTTFAEEYQSIKKALQSGDLDDAALDDLVKRFRNLKGEANSAGLSVSQFFTNMQTQLRTVLQRWVSLYAVVGYIRQMVNSVKELDSAMVELRKVTTATDAEFEKFLQSAGKTARQLGASISDVVNATATFARLGESLPDAEELGRIAVLYKNVGDGIDIDTASEDLVSTMKAFNIEAENAIEIVDKFNEVGNNFAISSGGIGEALKRSASALAAANNDISSSIALITTANTVAQDPTTVGQGIKTVSLRLRSTKTELQEIGEDAEGAAENISKLREQILGLTGVDIQLDESTYKSTYQILLEISKVWGKLDDLSRSSVLEQLFGKRQANIGAAILENGELLQKVYESAEQSAGSAMKEQLEYAKSIQYSIDTVKAAFQDFSQTAINSEFIRGVLQMAKSLLEWLDRIVDKIGLLPPILAVIGAYLGAKKGIAILSFIKSLYTGLVGLITATNSAAIATKALSTAWKVLGNVLVAAAISGVIWALDKLIVTQREAEEEFNNMVDEAYQSTEKYKEEAKELDSLTQKYIDIKNSTADITTKKEQLTSLQEQLVKSYGKEAGGIDLVNGSLEENIKLLNERRKLNAEDYISKNKGKYEEAVENLGYGYYRVGKNLPNEFRRELEEIANRFDNYNAATGQIEGSFEERLETLKKIRDIYSEQEGHNSKWLSQLEGQIDEYKNIYDLLTNIVDESKKAQEIASITPQQQNIITQATEAYKAYQTALEEGNKSEARNARSALEGIKEVMYSITEPTSVLRQDFDEMWAGFNLGSETALSRIAQVKNDFDELSDNFGKSLKNVEKINSAIESMLSGEYLSHDDAWELLKYDTDGVLKDIKIVNGKYKFDTEQLMALMRQKIDLQKTSIQAIKDQAEAERTLLNSQLLRLTTSINSASDYRIYKQKISDINGELKDTENIIDKCGYLLEELNVELGRAEVLTSSTAKQLSATIAAYEDEIKAIEDTIDSLKDRKDILEDEKKQLQEQLEILNKQKEVLEETLKNYDAVADAVADYVKIQTDSIQKQIDALKEQKKLIEDSYDERIKALKAENDERDLALRKEQALIDLANAENQKKKVWSSDRGIEWGTSADDVAKARKTLADIEAEELINALEKEKEEALKGFDEKEKAYESQIKTFEEYAKKYTDVASDIQKAENEMLADQILGSNWREEVIKEATDNLGVQLNAEQKEIVDDYKAIMQEINDYNVDLNKTVFGNIDTNQRQVLEWNDENLSKFANSIESWGETAEDLRDTVSTVFGVWDTFDGVDIAFSPMLQTPNGAVLLDADTVWDYIYGLIDKAGEGWTSEMLFKLDTEGLKVDGVEVKNLIADIGETAEETSRTMHYVGTDGAYALVCREVENVAKTLDVGIEKVLDTNKALVGNSKMLITYTNNYKNFNSQLKNLVNNEIASLNASIEAKDKEINKIQDEIDAYNKYKDTVKTSLDNAKTEFENYKNTLDRVVPLINEAHEKMEGATWDRHNKVKDYYKEMAEAAESARDRICTANANIQAALEGMRSNSAVLAGVALIGGIVGSHAEGGVNSSTGLAMLHGTKQRSETIFNANDSKKLYDFIHTTPNLIAASMKQATKIAGVNPSNITNNSNASNINVSIGQVVANNPQEFTRNLDTHIDSYFKRKLTEGYVR